MRGGLVFLKTRFVGASTWRSPGQYLCTSVSELLAKLNKQQEVCVCVCVCVCSSGHRLMVSLHMCKASSAAEDLHTL